MAVAAARVASVAAAALASDALLSSLVAHQTVARPPFPCPLSCRNVQGTRAAKVRAGAVINTERELHKLFTVMAERYAGRAGGYTRVLRAGLRRHDTTPMAYIE